MELTGRPSLTVHDSCTQEWRADHSAARSRWAFARARRSRELHEQHRDGRGQATLGPGFRYRGGPTLAHSITCNGMLIHSETYATRTLPSRREPRRLHRRPEW